MAILMSTIAIYAGEKTGKTQKGNEWKSLQFRNAEAFKGNVLQADGISKPNLSVFLTEEDNFGDLLEGSRYRLDLAIDTRKDSGYVSYELIKLELKS